VTCLPDRHDPPKKWESRNLKEDKREMNLQNYGNLVAYVFIFSVKFEDGKW